MTAPESMNDVTIEDLSTLLERLLVGLPEDWTKLPPMDLYQRLETLVFDLSPEEQAEMAQDAGVPELCWAAFRDMMSHPTNTQHLVWLIAALRAAYTHAGALEIPVIGLRVMVQVQYADGLVATLAAAGPAPPPGVSTKMVHFGVWALLHEVGKAIAQLGFRNLYNKTRQDAMTGAAQAKRPSGLILPP